MTAISEPRVALIVLAAGTGTRMRSRLPKPLHPVAGKPMISHVLTAGAAVNPITTVLVVGRETADIAATLALADAVITVRQDPPRGTGEAARLALPACTDATHLAVVFADNPLLTGEVMRQLIGGAVASGALVTLMTAIVAGGADYGRIVRGASGEITAIKERKDDPERDAAGPVEINSGLMVIDAAWAWETLPHLTPSPHSGEVYLTELVTLAMAAPRGSDASPAVHAEVVDASVALGVNDRRELAAAEGIMRRRIHDALFAAGVTIVAPETVVIDCDVSIGPDTTIHPFSYLQAGTTIGRDCVIGPHAVITGSRLGDRVTVRDSTVTSAEVGDDSDVGPYSHLRPGTRLGQGVHIGNFGELKNAQLADGVKVGHFGYLGDVRIGAETNIGAGTITANYDGARKHQTIIGAGAFIGSDSILRAPVTIGDGAVIGAGSVVTRDVPAGALAVGLPARIVRQAASAPPAAGSPATDLPDNEEA